jgi:hypothetical protein
MIYFSLFYPAESDLSNIILAIQMHLMSNPSVSSVGMVAVVMVHEVDNLNPTLIGEHFNGGTIFTGTDAILSHFLVIFSSLVCLYSTI